MIISNKYQFIHLHKCGGSTIAFMLMNYFDGCRHGGIHNSENYNNQPIIGCIRNPFSWYVSLWSYGLEGKGQIYEEILKDYPELIGRFYTRFDDLAAFQHWLEFLIGDKTIGLLTKRMRKLYFHANRFCLDYIIYQENLEDDFKRIMKQLGYSRNYVDNMDIEAKNQSYHLPFMQYYTPLHKELVLSKDKEVFMLFYKDA